MSNLSFSVTGIDTEAQAEQLCSDLRAVFPFTHFIVDYSEVHGYGVFASAGSPASSVVRGAKDTAAQLATLRGIAEHGVTGYFQHIAQI